MGNKFPDKNKPRLMSLPQKQIYRIKQQQTAKAKTLAGMAALLGGKKP
jgi:hypothetical protein